MKLVINKLAKQRTRFNFRTY